MTVTDANTATNNDSPNTINTSPHTPNASTASDSAAATVENYTSVIQLLDGQEYPVAKGDNIKKVFDNEVSVSQCVA